MPFETDGILTTDVQEIANAYEWDTQAEWNAFQSKTDITIENGVVKLTEISAIPDSGDLQMMYDFSQEDGSLPVVDLANSNDLGNGGYSGVGVTINGTQAGEFDATNDDGVWGSLSNVTEPAHDFIVVDVRSFVSPGDYIYSTWNSSHPSVRITGSTFAARPANNDMTTARQTGIVLLETLFSSNGSKFWLDGSQVSSTGEGPDPFSEFGLANRGGTKGEADIYVGEFLRYTGNKESSAADIRSYLSDKWGLGI